MDNDMASRQQDIAGQAFTKKEEEKEVSMAENLKIEINIIHSSKSSRPRKLGGWLLSLSSKEWNTRKMQSDSMTLSGSDQKKRVLKEKV